MYSLRSGRPLGRGFLWPRNPSLCRGRRAPTARLDLPTLIPLGLHARAVDSARSSLLGPACSPSSPRSPKAIAASGARLLSLHLPGFSLVRPLPPLFPLPRHSLRRLLLRPRRHPFTLVKAHRLDCVAIRCHRVVQFHCQLCGQHKRQALSTLSITQHRPWAATAGVAHVSRPSVLASRAPSLRRRLPAPAVARPPALQARH